MVSPASVCKMKTIKLLIPLKNKNDSGEREMLHNMIKKFTSHLECCRASSSGNKYVMFFNHCVLLTLTILPPFGGPTALTALCVKEQFVCKICFLTLLKPNMYKSIEV